MLVLIIGAGGFIGSHIVSVLSNKNVPYICTKIRSCSYDKLCNLINKFKPTHVIYSAGCSAIKDVECYETKQESMTFVNTTGVLMCAHICWEYSLHFTVIMSGDIYEGGPHKDSDIPNFAGNAYARNRILTEQLLRVYKNACILRIRKPVSNDLHYKSSISKILSRDSVTYQRNSITVLDDMIPFIYYVISHNITGVINLVNESTVSDVFIASIFKCFVSNNHSFNKIKPNKSNTYAKCNNCELIVSDIVKKYIHVPTAIDSIRNIIKSMKRVVDIYC